MKHGTMTCMPLRLGKVAPQGLPVLYEELSSSGQHTSLIRDGNRCLDERLCVSYCWHCFCASACITHLLPNVNLWQNKCNICKPWRVILTNVFFFLLHPHWEMICAAGSEGRRARWPSEWNGHIWDCKILMIWVLFIIDKKSLIIKQRT